MKFILIICGFLIVSIKCLTKECKSYDSDDHGFGCELKGIKIEAEENEINLIAKHDWRDDSDIIWISISYSVLHNLPRNMFLKFFNMEKIFIENCSGFKNFDKAYFDIKIKYIHLSQTDIEYVGDKVFAGLKSFEKLYLTNNKIKNLHKNAFKDLENLVEICMNNNLIEHLDDDIFIWNFKLMIIYLNNNRMKTINAKLFSQNILLEHISIANNYISNIDENFVEHLEHLEYLKFLDLSNNICINTIWNLEPENETILLLKTRHYFSDCIQNIVNKSELDLILTNTQILKKQIQEMSLKAKSNWFNYLIILFVIIVIGIGYYLFHKQIQRPASEFESNQFSNLSSQ